MKKAALFYIVLLLAFVITGLTGCGEESEEDAKEGGGGPSIFSTIPKNNAQNVPTTTAIMVTFSNDIVTPSVANLAFTPGVSGDVSYDPNTYTLIFRPSAALSNVTDYSMTIDGITDLEGNSMSPATISFTTSVPDTERPEITSTSPEDGQKDICHDAEILVRFNEPMDRVRFRSGISFDPKVDVSADEWNLKWGIGDDEEVIISPPVGTDPFEVDEEYMLKLLRDSVTDLSGNPILADYRLKFGTLKYPVEKIGNLSLSGPKIEPVWMYSIGKWGNKWVIAWGGTQPRGAPSQNNPSGTITASADGQILDSVDTIASNADNAFTPTVTKGNGNRLTYQTVALNNNRRFWMVISSTSSYVTFDLRSSAGTIPAQYVHVGGGGEHPSRTPFTIKNK